jgi:hypothetical protein
LIFDFSSYKKKNESTMILYLYTTRLLLCKQRWTLQPSGHHASTPYVMRIKKITNRDRRGFYIYLIRTAMKYDFRKSHVVWYDKYFLGIFNIRTTRCVVSRFVVIAVSRLTTNNTLNFASAVPPWSRACSGCTSRHHRRCFFSLPKREKKNYNITPPSRFDRSEWRRSRCKPYTFCVCGLQ